MTADCLSNIMTTISDTSNISRMSVEYPTNVCQLFVKYLAAISKLPMSTKYLTNVCRTSNECLLNVCQIYLTTMSDNSYVNQISANCLSNIRRMSVECHPNLVVRHFLHVHQLNIRQMSGEYLTNAC